VQFTRPSGCICKIRDQTCNRIGTQISSFLFHFVNKLQESDKRFGWKPRSIKVYQKKKPLKNESKPNAHKLLAFQRLRSQDRGDQAPSTAQQQLTRSGISWMRFERGAQLIYDIRCTATVECITTKPLSPKIYLSKWVLLLRYTTF